MPSGRANESWETAPEASSTWTWTSMPVAGVTRSAPRSRRWTPSARSTSVSSHGPLARRSTSPTFRRPCGVIESLPYPSRRSSRIPPMPRWEPGRSDTSTSRAVSTRCTSSWAMRSPRCSSTVASRSWLTRMTRDLAPVAGVDDPGGVDQAHAVPQGEPAAGAHQRDVARRAARWRCRSARAHAPPGRATRRSGRAGPVPASPGCSYAGMGRSGSSRVTRTST